MADRTGRAGTQPADLPLPTATLDAAVRSDAIDALLASRRLTRAGSQDWATPIVNTVLAAAAPALRAQGAAAEREAIRQLAQLRGATWQPTAICYCISAGHPYNVGPPAPFADLLAARGGDFAALARQRTRVPAPDHPIDVDPVAAAEWLAEHDQNGDDNGC